MARFRFLAWLVDWLLLQNGFRFDWDEGNQTKSAEQHSVSCEEAEEVFPYVKRLSRSVSRLPLR